MFRFVGTLLLMTSSLLAAPQSIVVGGGCFWCLDGAYRVAPGVLDVISGYAGGHVKNPSYEEVCRGKTGHAEVVRVVYDDSKTTLDEVLDLFWVMHDPTQVDGQGADLGPQYRSIILFTNEAQAEAARRSKAKAQTQWKAPLTTEIVPLEVFWAAEDYHQDYFRKNPYQGYCQAVVRPKVKKVEQHLKKAAEKAP